jgi:non-heme chloroperoxidase
MQRRALWKAIAAALVGSTVASGETIAAGARTPRGTRHHFVTSDGTSLYFKDWGTGPAIVFAAPWALNSDWWEYQMAYLASRGLRCIAYDRRGHGRSDEPAHGYEFDTLAGDLATLLKHLALRDVTLVGHSMGCAEVVRYLSRYTSRGVARAVLISTITPFTLKTADNPAGVEESELEKGRVALAKDRAHQIAAAAAGFFGAPPSAVSPEMMDWWVRMILDQCSLKVMLDLHRSFTTTDFRSELRKLSVPVLLIHGDRDTSTPIEATGHASARLIPGCELRVYENAAHGLPITHADRLNADLLAFARN